MFDLKIIIKLKGRYTFCYNKIIIKKTIENGWKLKIIKSKSGEFKVVSKLAPH